MLRLIDQKGPLSVNVDAVQWHDYIGIEKPLINNVFFPFIRFGLKKKTKKNYFFKLKLFCFR